MDGPFLCEFCSELLASPKCLERHLKIHEVKDYQFLCYTCNKPFKNSDQLKHHERTHKTVKLIKCKYCHLKFRNRGSIVLHLESTHAWMKPFRCEKCHVGYSLSMECNAHVASHDVESLLMCPLCYRCFSQPLNLSIHLKKKHDIREVFRTKGVSSQTHAFLDCEWPFLKFIERIDTKDHCIYHGASRYVFTSNFSVKSLAHLLMEKYQFLRECMIKSGKTPKCQSYVKRKRRKIKPTAKESVVKKAESFRCKVKKLFSTYSVAPLLKKARRLKRYFKEIRKEIRKIQSKSGLPNSQPLTRKLLSESLSPKSSTLSSFVGLIPHNDLVQVSMPSGNNRVVPCIVRVLPQPGSMMKAPPTSLERIIAPKPPKPIILEERNAKTVTGHVSVPCLVRARQVVDKSLTNKPNQFTTTKKPIANPKQGRSSPPIYAKRPNILSKPRSFLPNTPPTANPFFSQGSTSWQQHPQFTASWQQGAQGSTSWQQHPQFLSTSAFKSNFQNIMFPDRNRMNTRFPIPTLNAESLAALSTCSYEDLSTFVEEFSILLVNKYFLSIFSPVQFPTYFIGNPPPTLTQLPQPVMRDLIVKQVDGQLIRRRIAEEVCRQITPPLINIPSTSSTVIGGSQAAPPTNVPSTSSTIKGGTRYNAHQPYTVSWTPPKRTETSVKPLLNPASPSTSFIPSQKPYLINAATHGKSGVSEAWLSSMKAYSGSMLPPMSTQIYSPRPPNFKSFESFKASTIIPTIVHVQKSFGSPMNLAIRQPIKGQTFIPLKDYMPIIVKVNRSNKFSSIPIVPSENILNRVEQIENVSGKNFRLFEIIIVVPKLRIPKEDCVFRVISGGIAVKRLSKKGDDDSSDTYFDWSNQILTKRSLSSVENLKSGVVKKIPGGFAVRKSLLKTSAKVGRVCKTTTEKSKVTSMNSQLMTIEIEPPRKGRPPKFIQTQHLEARGKPKRVNKNKSLKNKRKNDHQEAAAVKNVHYPIRNRSSSVHVDAEDQFFVEDSKILENSYKYPLRNKQSYSKKVEINSQPPKKKIKTVAKAEKLESSEDEDGCFLDSQTGNWKKVQKKDGTNESPSSKNKSFQESKIGLNPQDLELLLSDFQDRRLTRSRVKNTQEMTKSLTPVTKHSKTSANLKPLSDIDETRSLKNSGTKPMEVGEKTDQLQLESSCESNGSNSNERTGKSEPNFKNSLQPKSTKSSESKTSNKKSKSPASKPAPPQSIKLWLPSDPEQTNEILEQCGFELSDTQPYRSKPPGRKLPKRQNKTNKPSSSARKSESKESERKSTASNSEASSDENLPLDLTQSRNSRSKKRFSTDSLDDDSQQTKTRKTEPQDQRPSTSKDFRELLPKQLRKTNNSSQINFPDFSNRSLNIPSLSQKADEEMLDEPSTSRRGLRKDKKLSTITNESWKAKVKSKKNEDDSPVSPRETSTSRNSLRKLRNQVPSVSVQPNIAKTLKTSSQKPQKQSKYEPLIIDVKTHVGTSPGNQNSKNFVDADAKSLSPTESVPLVAPKRLRSWNLCNRN